MTATETIFALSSGAGRAAVAVIRVSGPAAAELLSSLTGTLPDVRALSLKTLRDPDSGEVLDTAMVAWLPGPRSFTGEDCCELHLHGSHAVVSAVLRALARHHCTRPADPGEFTRRAFLNGKLDLVEVEGLADLLDARTAVQRRQALRQMSGQASDVFDGWRHQLLLIRADIEAVVDFADEPGVAEVAIRGIDGRIRKLHSEISAAIAAAPSSEIVREGVRVVLAGLPNTGKSSLLNVLARREAAIVSDLPGTTRDSIEVSMDIGGVPVVLTDTAGLRASASDKVEEEGIRRTHRHLATADVIVWVSAPDVEGSEVVRDVPVPELFVENKADLNLGLVRNDPREGCFSVSTRNGNGIPAFLARLSALLRERYGSVESSLLVTARQSAAAKASIRMLNEALAVRAEQLELKAENIRIASDEIGRLTGRVHVEEWLGAIFSRFCIGK